MSDDVRALALTITGRVQGVCYRAFTRDAATGLGVRGWVVNRADGAVEAAVKGSGPALADLIGRLRRGPPAAAVDNLEVRSVDHAKIDEPPNGAYVF